MTRLIFVFLVATIVTSNLLADEILKRPGELKAQVDVMKTEVPTRFECMMKEIKANHPNDKSTQLYVLKKQVSAYWDIREADYPKEILYAALTDHPCDFSTANYVVKKQIKAESELSNLLN